MNSIGFIGYTEDKYLQNIDYRFKVKYIIQKLSIYFSQKYKINSILTAGIGGFNSIISESISSVQFIYNIKNTVYVPFTQNFIISDKYNKFIYDLIHKNKIFYLNRSFKGLSEESYVESFNNIINLSSVIICFYKEKSEDFLRKIIIKAYKLNRIILIINPDTLSINCIKNKSSAN